MGDLEFIKLDYLKLLAVLIGIVSSLFSVRALQHSRSVKFRSKSTMLSLVITFLSAIAVALLSLVVPLVKLFR